MAGIAPEDCVKNPSLVTCPFEFADPRESSTKSHPTHKITCILVNTTAPSAPPPVIIVSRTRSTAFLGPELARVWSCRGCKAARSPPIELRPNRVPTLKRSSENLNVFPQIKQTSSPGPGQLYLLPSLPVDPWDLTFSLRSRTTPAVPRKTEIWCLTPGF